MNISAIYLHIPFCKRRCFYCDFPITVLGNSAGNHYSNSQKEYVEWLCREIKIATKDKAEEIKTIFFGGGTPSLLAIEGLKQIFTTLNDCFNISKKAEISLEIDPATFDLTRLKQYQSLGINRVSLGVQAFQENLLQTSGRFHTVKDIYQAVEWINQANFANWSLDLISGLPHQTISQWQESLQKAIALKPKHISCYDLVLEESTVFGKKYQQGNHPLPPDEITAEMYSLASETLSKAGYNHYEISNYALNTYECKHNLIYWKNQNYYGFGMGSASYTNNQRYTRPRTRKDYFTWVETLEANNGKITTHTLSKNDQLLETLMLNLRLKTGVNLQLISDKFGEDKITKIKKCLQPYQENNMIILDSESNQLHLTDPQGFLYSNSILADLFAIFS